MERLRLDKLVCDLFKLTRKQAKADIAAGNITVNGVVSKKCAEHYLTTDKVERNGEIARYQKYVYIMLNKPKGVLSATSDRFAKTAIDLLPKEMRQRDLFVAGRLDKNTTGFLLLTNDGDFAHNILSPKKHIAKTYVAELRNSLRGDETKMFSEGIKLNDFVCKPAKLLEVGPRKVEITVVEGKFHQIKRMFAAVNNEVLELHRVRMGGLMLDDTLAAGQARYITEDELELLKDGKFNE